MLSHNIEVISRMILVSTYMCFMEEVLHSLNDDLGFL